MAGKCSLVMLCGVHKKLKITVCQTMLKHTRRDANLGNGPLAYITWLFLQTIPLGIESYKKACNWKVCNYEIIIIITDVIGWVENAELS